MSSNDEDNPTSSEKVTKKDQRLKQLQDLQQKETELFQVQIDSLIKNIIKHKFIDSFEDFLLKNSLSKCTRLEQFILDRKEHDFDSEDKEIKLLNHHVDKWPSNKLLNDPVMEKKLINFVKDLMRVEATKKPKWLVSIIENMFLLFSGGTGTCTCNPGFGYHINGEMGSS